MGMFNLAQLAVEVIPKGIKTTIARLRKLTSEARDAERAKRKLKDESGKTSTAFERLNKKLEKSQQGMSKFRGSMVGLGVGSALTGLRPVAELMFMDFFGVYALYSSL